MDIRQMTDTELGSGAANLLNKASFFSSPSFINLWRTVGGRPVYYAAGESDRPIAVLPGIEFGRRRVTRFQSMPNGCYCLPVSMTDDQTEYSTACAGFLSAIKNSRYLNATVTDYYGVFEASNQTADGQNTADLVDISNPDWQPPDKKLMSEIRKAEREGLTDQPFDRERHMDGFLELVSTSTDRQKRKSLYPKVFFDELARIAGDDSRIIWLFAERDGKPVASHINIRLGDMLLHWHVYSDRSYSSFKPNQYLLYRAARIASSRGVKQLNLGATPPDADSLRAYKAKWGGTEYSYNRFEFRSTLGRLL